MNRLAILLTLAIFAGCCLAAWAAVPHDGVARETVDLIEVNHFYDDYGRLTFEQVVFYDWSRDDARYMVRSWRLIKHPSQIPQRDWANGGYLCVWQDGELMRTVRAKQIRETWTQHDPELAELEVLPKERRKELPTPFPPALKAAGRIAKAKWEGIRQ